MLKLYRRRLRATLRGTVYAVHLGSPEGEIVVARSRDPEHAAARALAARGYKGPFTVYSPSLTEAGKWTPAVVFRSAEVAGRRTIRETVTVGPRFVEWKELPEIVPKQAIAA